MTEDANSRKVTIRELNDKLEVVRAEQKTEHTRTRALVVVFGAPALITKAAAVIGLIQLPHLPF